MKATRFAMILALLSFALMSFSSNENDRVPVGVKISIDKAIKDRALVFEMYRQIDESFLNFELSGYYYTKVRYNRATIVIFGSYKQWKNFFAMDNLPIEPKRTR